MAVCHVSNQIPEKETERWQSSSACGREGCWWQQGVKCLRGQPSNECPPYYCCRLTLGTHLYKKVPEQMCLQPLHFDRFFWWGKEAGELEFCYLWTLSVWKTFQDQKIDKVPVYVLKYASWLVSSCLYIEHFSFKGGKLFHSFPHQGEIWLSMGFMLNAS